MALGTNIGDRVAHLRFALEHLPGVVTESQVFETDPVGGPENQDAYLNMVIALDTHLDPYALLLVGIHHHVWSNTKWTFRTIYFPVWKITHAN